ncbi:hypothetical protein FRC17_007183 [Serendipita sp. 399]|nr:hypothetical protein FRC17_007183 [Serendipita sp. 399]
MQLRQQNAEQQQLLVTLLDEYRNASAQQSSETIEAVRAAVAQHVPMDIKGHLNEFSKSLAEEVRLLLREVGKLREEKRNIQYEIGCMLCLKSKYGPGGEFDPEWRPPTGPYANGPPMPEAPAEGAAPAAEELRPTTAQPAWRTIQQKRKPGRKREQPVPQQQPQMQPQPPTPMPMPVPAASSVPPPAPMPVPMQTATFTATGPPPSAMPPPSVMDQSRQQSWYAWQREFYYFKAFITRLNPSAADPRYVPSSPSSAPMYEVPDTRPLGFFGPRSPRDFNF